MLIDKLCCFRVFGAFGSGSFYLGALETGCRSLGGISPVGSGFLFDKKKGLSYTIRSIFICWKKLLFAGVWKAYLMLRVIGGPFKVF